MLTLLLSVSSITERLGEKLKGLFVLFAGHFLKHAAEVLDLNNSGKQTTPYFGDGADAERKTCSLISCILGTFHKIFLFDSENFINKDRFDLVLQPIVDQVGSVRVSFVTDFVRKDVKS